MTGFLDTTPESLRRIVSGEQSAGAYTPADYGSLTARCVGLLGRPEARTEAIHAHWGRLLLDELKLRITNGTLLEKSAHGNLQGEAEYPGYNLLRLATAVNAPEQQQEFVRLLQPLLEDDSYRGKPDADNDIHRAIIAALQQKLNPLDNADLVSLLQKDCETGDYCVVALMALMHASPKDGAKSLPKALTTMKENELSTSIPMFMVGLQLIRNEQALKMVATELRDSDLPEAVKQETMASIASGLNQNPVMKGRFEAACRERELA